MSKSFHHCDFVGDFDQGKIGFSDCNFAHCDFGIGLWDSVKFKDCTFKRCSFSLATFQDCEFRDCTWEEIGISGNELRIIRTTMTNPDAFIRAAYTNLDQKVLDRQGVNSRYQLMRLERTKATTARTLLLSISHSGDDEAYYLAVKTSANQTLQASFSFRAYQLSKLPLYKHPCVWAIMAVNRTEWALMNLFGFINQWGASIGRTLMFGLAIYGIFAALYLLPPLRDTLAQALMRSFDISLLVGYDKQSSSFDPFPYQYIMGLHVALAIAWYAVFAATVVGRVSRAR